MRFFGVCSRLLPQVCSNILLLFLVHNFFTLADLPSPVVYKLVVSSLIHEVLHTSEKRAISSNFGICLKAIVHIVIEVDKVQQHQNSPCVCPLHILWALRFLRVYCTEDQAAAFWQVSRKTLRKWTWHAILLMEQILPQVDLFL